MTRLDETQTTFAHDIMPQTPPAMVTLTRSDALLPSQDPVIVMVVVPVNGPLAGDIELMIGIKFARNDPVATDDTDPEPVDDVRAALRMGPTTLNLSVPGDGGADPDTFAIVIVRMESVVHVELYAWPSAWLARTSAFVVVVFIIMDPAPARSVSRSNVITIWDPGAYVVCPGAATQTTEEIVGAVENDPFSTGDSEGDTEPPKGLPLIVAVQTPICGGVAVEAFTIVTSRTDGDVQNPV